MDIRPGGVVFRRAFWTGLILCAVPIAYAIVNAVPAMVSALPTQTTPAVAVTLTYATGSVNATGTVVVGGLPAGVNTLPSPVTYPYTLNSTSASTSFRFAVGAGTTPGTYPITLRDAFGAGTTTVTLVVNTPSYTASVAPNPTTLVIGGTAQSVTVTTKPDPGFGAKQLTYSFSGFPSFINVPPAQTTPQPYNPLTFTFSLGAGATPGAYSGTLTGVDELGVQKVFPNALTIIVQQPDISAIFSNPAINVCQGGAPASDAINLAPVNGYSGTPRVAFTSIPAGVNISALPAAAAMPPNQSLPFNVDAGTAAPGTYIAVLNVSDPAANINKNVNLSITVTAPDYTPAAIPNAITLTAGGGGQSINASITPNACFTSTVTVTPAAPPGITFTPTSSAAPATFVAQAASNVAPGTYTSTFTFTPASGTTKTQNVTITVVAAPDFRLTVAPPSVTIAPGQSTTVNVSAAGVNGFAGSITVNAPALAGIAFSPQTFSLLPGASQTVTISAASNATPALHNGVFTGTAPGITGSRTAPIAVNVVAGPDFTLTADPSSLSIASGGTSTLTVSTQPLNGFTGSVSVTSPGSADVTFTPSAFTIPAGGSQTVTVKIAPGAAPATFSGVFTGTATGVGTHTAPVLITITGSPDFTLSVSPSMISLAQSASMQVSVLATGLNGFSGPVSVTTSPTAGVSVTPSAFTLTPGTPLNVTISIGTSTLVSSGSVLFSGTAAGVSGPRTATLNINVSGRPDYALTAAPSATSIAAGSSGNVTIGVVGSNAFTGGVAITATPPPGVSLNPPSFTIAPGQTQQVEIDIAANATVGPATLRFIGNSDPTHFVDVALSILPPRPVITTVVPPAVATGERSIVERLLGRFFEPGARVSVVNPGVRIENVNVITPEIADVTMSVIAEAPPGATTLMLTNPDGGSATATLLVYPRGSIAAPLGVTTAAIVFPAEGTMIAPSQNVFPRGLLATTGTGTIIGVWKFDGVPFDRFTVNVGGGYPAEVRTHLPLPISYEGAHTLELQIESPQFAAAPSLHVLMAPNSVSRLTLLAPRDGMVIGSASPLFRWSLVPNSSGYVVEIDNDLLPRRFRLSDAQWKPSARTLQEIGPGIHRWRVRAVFAGETESEPTEWQRFAIVPQHVDLTATVQQRHVRWRGGVSGLLYRVDVLDAAGNVVYSALTAASDFAIPPGVGGTSVRVTAIGPGGVVLGASPTANVGRAPAKQPIALVQQKPAVTNQQPADGSKVATNQPHISATWSGTVKAQDVAMTLDQTDVTNVSKIDAASINYDSLLPLANGTHSVRLSLAGAVTTWSFDVEVAPEAAQPAAPSLQKDWAVTPNGTITAAGGDAPGQPNAARTQFSAQTDLAENAKGAKVTGDMSVRHDLADPNKTVQESRNWLTDFTRQQGLVQPEAKIGYAAPDFLDQSELLATGVARGGVEGRLHLFHMIASGYETFGTKPAGVLAGDFGPKTIIRAAALQTEPNDKWDFRLMGFRVTDDAGPNSAGGVGKAFGVFAKYIFDPKLTLIFEGSHGGFDPNPTTVGPKHEGSALRLDATGNWGTFAYVLNLRRTEADYVNPANRALTPGGVPDRTGANLSLTKVINRTSLSLQLRTLRDGNSSGAILPRNRENGGVLAVTTSIGQRTTLALGGNWTADRGSGNPSYGLPDLDRTQSGANGTVTEAIGIFNLSQTMTVQKLHDRITPISDSTTSAATLTFGGTPTPYLNLSAVLSGTRTAGSSAVGTTDQYLASLQPSWTLPNWGIMLQPRVNFSRSKNDLTNLESRSEDYQALVTWTPQRLTQHLSLQFSADANRSSSTGQIPPPKFIHQYVGTMSFNWGASSGQAMNGTTVVAVPASINATKTNNPSTTSAVSQ